MALSVTPVQNASFGGVQAPNNPLVITSTGVAHPAPLTNNVVAPKTATPAAAPAPTPDYSALIAAASAANRQVYAPALDVKSIYNQSTANANSIVNGSGYYTKLMNDFIAQQGQAKAFQQSQTATNIQNLQDQLTNLQQGNAVSGQRATEDTATKEAQAAQVADQTQQDQGTQFNTDRNALAVKEANAGLTGSGLAAGAQATAQQTHDVTEQRQAQADQSAKDATELAKARTFEDLATSNKIGQQTETKGEAQANFDLNKFITGQAGDLVNQQNTVEAQRRAAVASEQQNQTKILVSNFINSIANPAQRAAAYSAYGGLL